MKHGMKSDVAPSVLVAFAHCKNSTRPPETIIKAGNGLGAARRDKAFECDGLFRARRISLGNNAEEQKSQSYCRGPFHSNFIPDRNHTSVSLNRRAVSRARAVTTWIGNSATGNSATGFPYLRQYPVELLATITFARDEQPFPIARFPGHPAS
jgi:hypothetical protein